MRVLSYKKLTDNYLDFSEYRDLIFSTIGIPIIDNDRDTELEFYFKTAQNIIEKKLGVSLAENEFKFTLEAKNNVINILYSPIEIISLTQNNTVINQDNYYFDDDLKVIKFKNNTCCNNLITIEFKGLEKLTDLLIMCLLLITKKLFDTQGACVNEGTCTNYCINQLLELENKEVFL